MIEQEAPETGDESDGGDDEPEAGNKGDRVLNIMFSKYWPGPGDYHCHKCVEVYWDRLEKIRDEYGVEAFGGSQSQQNGDGGEGTSASTSPGENGHGTLAANEFPVNNKTSVKGRSLRRDDDASSTKKPDNALAETERLLKGGKVKIQIRTGPGADAISDDARGSETDETSPVQQQQERLKLPKHKLVWFPPWTQWGGRVSQFTEEEQAKFVAMMCNLKNEGKFRFDENKALYKEMKERLAKETDKFNLFVAQYNRSSLVKANNFFPRHMTPYFSCCFQAKSSIIQSLPGQYTLKGTHCVSMPMQEPPRLEFSKHLLDVGKAPRVMVPQLTTKVTVPIDDDASIEEKYPCSEKAKEGVLWSDPNVPTLACKYGAGVVASASAVRSLMLWCGPWISKQCELPLSVAPIYVDGRREQVVIISKPLPPRALTARQQLNCLAKYALKTRMVHLKFDMEKARAHSAAGRAAAASKTHSSVGQEELKGEYDELFDDYDPDAVESFGAASSSSTAGQSKKSSSSPPPQSTSRQGTAGDDYKDDQTMSSPGSAAGALHIDDAMSDGNETDSANVGKTAITEDNSTTEESETEPPPTRRRRLSTRTTTAAVSKTGGKRGKICNSKTRPISDPAITTTSKSTTTEAATGDILGGILSGMDTTAPVKKSTGYNLEHDTWRPGEAPPVEDSREYSAPKKSESMHQYAMWTLRNIQLLIRSNVDGFCGGGGAKLAKGVRGGGGCARANITAKVEYQAQFGGEQQTDEETAYEWLTAFLKRADVQYRGRIKFNPDYDILAVDVLTRQKDLRWQQLGGAAQQLITNGMRRLHVVLEELKKLDNGIYILRIKSSEPNYTILQPTPLNETTDNLRNSTSKAELDLLQLYNRPNWLRRETVSSYDQCWRNIDPEAILQWHKVLKRIPTSFPFKEENQETNLVGETKNANKAPFNKKKKWYTAKRKKKNTQKQQTKT